MYRYGIKCEGIVCDRLSRKKYFSDVKLVPGSGKSFNKKEDIVSKYLLIQVKSTTDKEFTLKTIDFKKLNSNSYKSKKSPIFIVFFSESNSMKIFVPYLSYEEELKDYLNNNVYTEQFIITPGKKVKSDLLRYKYLIDGMEYFSLNENDFI